MICSCGSGEDAIVRVDGHGIYLERACDKCWPEKKRKHWREDIDQQYSCDEPIEPED